MNAARLHLAIDAGALAHDRRGMGRLVRGALRFFARTSGVNVTLLARGSDAHALSDQFEQETFAVAPPGSAHRHGRYDAVWFPFNGMRYVPAAPTLVTMHDAFAFTYPHDSRIARFREQAPMRRAAQKATRIAVQSRWTHDEIVRELRPATEPVVIAPVPDAFFFPARDETLPPPLHETPYVLIVGVREPRKNARLALEACARALREPETLVVAGKLSPTDRDVCRRLQVRYGEMVTATDRTLRALYRNAAVVLVPSLAEGFGLVAAEALACGAPVLAARAGAIPEATGDAAELLDPNDPARWAAALRAILDDPARAAALRTRGAARFASADRDAFARGTLTLLREIVSSGPSRVRPI